MHSSATAEQAAFYGTLINRRVTIRHACGTNTQVKATKRARSPFRKVRVHDVSEGGIALVLRNPPAVGATIALQMTNSLLGFAFDLEAEVRHAAPHQRGSWLVGLAFDRPLSFGELAALI